MSGKQTPPSAARRPPTPLPHSELALGSAVPRRSKYGNKKTEIDGIKFDSLKEARRYAQLRLLQAGKVIWNIKVHPVYPLVVNGVRIGKYIGDFSYIEAGVAVVEDVKGGNATKTPVWALKWRFMKAQNPHIDWRIV